MTSNRILSGITAVSLLGLASAARADDWRSHFRGNAESRAAQDGRGDTGADSASRTDVRTFAPPSVDRHVAALPRVNEKPSLPLRSEIQVRMERESGERVAVPATSKTAETSATKSVWVLPAKPALLIKSDVLVKLSELHDGDVAASSGVPASSAKSSASLSHLKSLPIKPEFMMKMGNHEDGSDKDER